MRVVNTWWTMTQGINTLIIETVGSCNLRCKMCPTNNYTAGKSLMGDSIFDKLGFDFVTFKPLDVLSSKEDLNSIVKKKSIRKRFLNLKEKYRDKIIVCEWDLSTNEIENDCLARAASGAIFINCIWDVSPCCNLAHPVPNVRKMSLFNYIKKDNFFSFGNIFSESLERIIESEMYKNFINAYKDSHLPAPCKGCRLVSEKLSRRMRKI